jgi:phosphoadenosine phosphosulfate reductase
MSVGLDANCVPILDLTAINARLEHASSAEILAWATETFGDRLVATSSFQTQSVPLLHLLAGFAPNTEVLFLDTGFHFPETLAFKDDLTTRLGLRVRSLRTERGHDAFRREHGELYRRDPDHCCYLNKVLPLQRALEGLPAWISGIRRDQTAQRADVRIVERVDGRFKIAPLANWSEDDVQAYLQQHDLPSHPLLEQGYRSIGCAPCTRPIARGEDTRAGRWAGLAKTECGLHDPPSS